MTENFGFLRNLLPGDLVLADRDFTIHDKVMFYYENLNIPVFTKGKSQLDPVKIEKTLNLANINVRFSLPKTTDLMSDIKFCAYGCCFTTLKANSSKDVGTGRVFMMKFIFELANILLVE